MKQFLHATDILMEKITRAYTNTYSININLFKVVKYKVI